MSWKTAILHELINQLAVTITFKKDDGDNLGETHVLLEYAMRLAIYAALTAIFLMVIALVVKLLWNCDGEGDEAEASGAGERTTENSRLLLLKDEVVFSVYGTNAKDLESGSSSSSEDDLYDGKICVICYDDQRNCFFFPCGHCVTCHTCAHRIMKDENKTCPICRRYIDKVKKLHIV
ncbi:hypothetical protein BUALT_Bualt04G0105100 [Buddleja alternifolia]|uniref:RING-type domain-containing protein n=1 Tax=Buddleja alternifolia TaxID=168488 RepID=A0AAV6XMT8_9LAMI|nr:hypothetical protein BUALT_Bualt04G0105100 [Buddleja alternifolia]